MFSSSSPSPVREAGGGTGVPSQVWGRPLSEADDCQATGLAPFAGKGPTFLHATPKSLAPESSGNATRCLPQLSHMCSILEGCGCDPISSFLGFSVRAWGSGMYGGIQDRRPFWEIRARGDCPGSCGFHLLAARVLRVLHLLATSPPSGSARD